MSRTHRKNWLGRHVREGRHAKRCLEVNCTTCTESRLRKQAPHREDPDDRRNAIRDTRLP